MRWRLRLPPRGIRLRTTVSATVVVATVLLGASLALLLLQRQQLTDALTQEARGAGDLIAAQITRGGVDAIDVTALGTSAGEPALLQVLDARDTVLVSSDDDYDEDPITDLIPEPGETEVGTVAELPDDEEPFVVVVTGVQTPDGLVRVITAKPLESVQRSTAVLLTLLSIGFPLVLLLVAATSYRLVGRSLAPVEGMRRRVAAVSVADQDARVPVPDTGDEIERLAHTMNSMLDRLQAAATTQHRFVADASHELRSPLSTIRATTELARSHPDAMDADTAARTVLTEIDRLERLVSDLLLLARSDEHGLVMRMTDVDLDDIVAGEGIRLRQAGVSEVVLQVRSVRVTGDPQHLVRAIHNLSDNAARYARSRVDVLLDVTKGQAQLDVIDDGPGIPDSERGRVFERFVRLDDSRERGTGGTGLGLAITRQIAREHGGEVEVLPSAPHRGAHVRLTIPLAYDPSHQSLPPRNP